MPNKSRAWRMPNRSRAWRMPNQGCAWWMPNPSRARLVLASACAWLILISGCASLVDAPAASTPLTLAALRVEIDAPAPLKALLGEHLDLARLARLGGDEAPDEIETRRLMAAAPAQARELLKTEGYFEPEISLRAEPGTPQQVNLLVSPGRRIQVAQLSVRVQGELERRLAAGDAQARATNDRLGQAGPLRSGAAFRNPDWSQTKLQWLSTLRAAGYAGAEVHSSQADIDVTAGSARLDAVLASGPLFLAGPLRVEGLVRHDLATVQHLAGFGPGQPLTEALLLDFQERVQSAGLFVSVSVGFDAQPETADAATVTLRLKELPLQQAILAAGISNDSGPRASVEYLHRRIFGWALSASNKLEWGRDQQRLGSDFLTHPGPGFRRWLLGVQVERLRSDTDVVLSQRLRLGLTRDTPVIDRLAFVEMLRSRQSVGASTVVDAGAVSGNLHLVLRRLDSALLPTRGFGLSLQLGAGQARSTRAESGPFGAVHSSGPFARVQSSGPFAPMHSSGPFAGVRSSGPFARVQARLTAYLPIDVLGAQWYAKARLEAGQIVKRDAVAVPDALGFRAGGDESVRGYAYRSLAPRVNGVVTSGNALLSASAELARPISDALPTVWGAVFVDAGRAVDRWQDFKPAVGYGVGLRWRSPIGPVRADLAWADELKKARLHLSAGVTF